MNVNGLPVDDPLARMPLIDFGSPQPPGQPPMFPWMAAWANARVRLARCDPYHEYL